MEHRLDAERLRFLPVGLDGPGALERGALGPVVGETIGIDEVEVGIEDAPRETLAIHTHSCHPGEKPGPKHRQAGAERQAPASAGVYRGWAVIAI